MRSDHLTTDLHVLTKIARAIHVTCDPINRDAHRVVIESAGQASRILTDKMSREAAENWRAHLIAAMVEASL